MKLYNTRSRSKEEFVPLKEGQLRLYACGPTVYNYFHIGNARAFLFFDVVRRYFEYIGYEVTYVQNITDIDDKIIEQAIAENQDFGQIAEKYAAAFLEDCASLGIAAPTHQPRATQVMPEIIALIKKLVDTGHAYEAQGDVYFDTRSLPEYGQLSGKKIDEQKTGARVAENISKRHPADFTLWKSSKPKEPFWASPWGDGRPGWHTECVVMSQNYLGESFDIHGGGIDLVFPHHENENAQAMALTGKPLARYWMHNGFLNIDGEKMSKSLKNFFTARDILAQYDAEAIRFFFLSKHYRSPIDFTRELIVESDKAVDNFYKALEAFELDSLEATQIHSPDCLRLEEDFRIAMNDDFNTARAIAILFDLVRLTKNNKSSAENRLDAARLLLKLGRVLGFFQHPEDRLSKQMPDLSKALIELILSYRTQARADKNWAQSDKIRDDLKALGIEIKDGPTGSTWDQRN
ncbi:MAG: cysteine--tRNA ligase [Candidatus Cloacimonetes bacterium]|jgi:cysteinyl-tRNA synthetase|nr:cysteine--tRNA ligase [Candidatus Cloacimonadota bacterium]MCK9584668.1 cysteine--tRNA ligase [Candidatus Cloacimonadota bacterium]MDY0228541.1 cysteine--tRNA ligase [Candidatus Cloacimonadaceae bacterium]